MTPVYGSAARESGLHSGLDVNNDDAGARLRACVLPERADG